MRRVPVVIAFAALLAAAPLTATPAVAASTPVTPVSGATYPVGITLEGKCSEDWMTYGYDALTSQFQSQNDDYGHVVGWQNGATGVWMGPGEEFCHDRINYPGAWRLHMKSDTYGDQYGPIFHVVAGAPNPCDGEENQIQSVQAVEDGAQTALSGLNGSLLYAGQTVTADTNVEFTMGDGALMRLAQGSSFKVQSCTWIKEKEPTPFKITLSLALGSIWARIPGKSEHMDINTERVVNGVRGTVLWVSYDKGVNTLHVDQGAVTLSPRKGHWRAVVVTAGHTATQSGNRAPVVKRAPISTQPPF